MKKILSLVFRPVNLLILWVLSYGFTLLITVALSIIKRRRMSHDNGLVGSGRITVVENPQFPENDFLRPGRQFPCRLRHAAVSYPDDAALQVYGASLKFADSEDESPFDIEMNTGTTSLFWNVFTFLLFGVLKNETAWWTFRNYYSLYPQGYEAAQNGVRWKPESYARLWYHSQTPTRFVDVQGTQYYVKYRLVPENHRTEPETGRVPAERLAYPNVANASPPRSEFPERDYIKIEYRERIKQEGHVRYLLQLQLHPVAQDDSPEVCNSNVEWDEATHPWRDLARVEIDKVWDWNESVVTRTSPDYAPRSLGILPAYSIFDYNSLNYMRAKSTLARNVRVRMDRWFGARPSPSPKRRVGSDDPYYT